MKNDIITWLIDGAIYAGKSLTVADISSRVLLVCFTSIHTTSAVRVPSLLTHLFGFDLFIMQVYTATLYQLCLSAQDVATLREEVQGVVEEEGLDERSRCRNTSRGSSRSGRRGRLDATCTVQNA